MPASVDISDVAWINLARFARFIYCELIEMPHVFQTRESVHALRQRLAELVMITNLLLMICLHISVTYLSCLFTLII